MISCFDEVCIETVPLALQKQLVRFNEDGQFDSIESFVNEKPELMLQEVEDKVDEEGLGKGLLEEFDGKFWG